MPDGVDLLAHRYFSKKAGNKDPILLIRSPYRRGSLFGLVSRIMAERGYQVLLQSVRGTSGSEGVFDPEVNEAKDGIATLAWLGEQDWFSGKVAMMGGSYLGYVQWAVATNNPPEYLRAMVPVVTASEFRSMQYPGECFALASLMSWLYLIHNQKKMGTLRGFISEMRSDRVLKPAYDHVPLGEADKIAMGERVGIFQDALANNEPGATYWAVRDHSKRVGKVEIPVHFVGCWYDFFLPQQLNDYLVLRDSGKTRPFLTIGPWTHYSFGVVAAGIRESISWFDAHLRGDASKLRSSPVRVYLMGAKRWLELPEWPPPDMRSVRWYLHEKRKLGKSPPAADSPSDQYDYDPKNPTPSIGGTFVGSGDGSRDNRKLERRPDVIVYTSDPFERDYSIVGPVSVELHVKSNLENTDFFARLCDVSPRGGSRNVCDGMIRLRPRDFANNRMSDGITRVAFELWPTAYSFVGGHKLRLQVSSGSHPRISRNLGGGEPLASAKTFKVAHQEIFHSTDHASFVSLPEYSFASS